jgi:hypothetical protein
MFYDTLEQAQESVDWNEVNLHMIANDWTWDTKIPTIPQLQATVSGLCWQIVKSERANTMCSTGGFNVYKFTWDSGKTEYQIVFDIS